MSLGELKQIRSIFFSQIPSVSPEMLQALIDTGGVTDGTMIENLKGLSPLEMRIQITVRKWAHFYRDFEEARKRAGNKRARSKQVNIVREAERVLQFWMPFLAAEDDVAGNFLTAVAQGNLGRCADRLSGWPSKKGRNSEFVLAACAEELAKLFSQFRKGKKPPWTIIGQVIAEGIPEAKAPKQSDLGGWIYGIVKRQRAAVSKVR